MNSEIFREYDIRGVYNKDFDAAFAKKLAKAFSSYLKAQLGKKDLKVSIGHDARLSSPEITSALQEGFIESGVFVYALGLITTPISYFSTFQLDIDGAIMVTGSHNPPDYNGFKISLGRTTISGSQILSLKQIIEAEDYISGNAESENYNIFPKYLERYKEEFQGIQKIPVVLDCGNGVAGCIVRKLFEQVGLEPEILFEEPDGSFPNHHPDPTVEENLDELKKAVIANKAKIGIGFDGDADRIGVVDENGKFLLGDEIICLISQDILRENKGAKIIGDVKCSDRMYDFIAKHGGEPIMWKTGHSLIKKKVKEEAAPFGGELSGHIFFADRNYGYDDSLYAALRLVELLGKSGKNLSELISDLPPAFNTPEIRLDTTEDKKRLIVEKMKEYFANKNDSSIRYTTIDGIRVSFENGWALVRSSNTQPVLSMRFEANSEENLQKIRSEIETEVQKYL